MIIVTGPDNSGKTTLIDQICEDWPSLIRLKSKGPSTNYDFWMETLMENPKKLSRLVCDRFFYDEFIYGPLVRGRISLTTQQQEVVHSLLVMAEPMVIQCHLIKDEKIFHNRPQHFDWETTLKTEELFNELLGPGKALQYWPLEALRCNTNTRVQNYLELMDDWLRLRDQCPYGRGQMRSPVLMVVGEKFSSNNKWKIPFERSKSAIFLHNVLRRASFSMDMVWFTNAVKTSEALSPMNLAALKRELNLLKPAKVLALGNRASGLLSAVGQSHTKVRHPGYYLRRYSRDKGASEFEEEFRMQMEIEEEQNEHK